MKIVRSLIVVLFTLSCFSGLTMAGGNKSLFVSLTSNDVNRAAMAVQFATRVKKEQQIPATLFLNVDGVKLADTTIPSPMHVSGKSISTMLENFMAAGGKVIVCPMCMKNVGGISKPDLIKGAVIGGSDITMPALFADGTTVLSY